MALASTNKDFSYEYDGSAFDGILACEPLVLWLCLRSNDLIGCVGVDSQPTPSFERRSKQERRQWIRIGRS